MQEAKKSTSLQEEDGIAGSDQEGSAEDHLLYLQRFDVNKLEKHGKMELCFCLGPLFEGKIFYFPSLFEPSPLCNASSFLNLIFNLNLYPISFF